MGNFPGSRLSPTIFMKKKHMVSSSDSLHENQSIDPYHDTIPYLYHIYMTMTFSMHMTWYLYQIPYFLMVSISMWPVYLSTWYYTQQVFPLIYIHIYYIYIHFYTISINTWIFPSEKSFIDFPMDFPMVSHSVSPWTNDSGLRVPSRSRASPRSCGVLDSWDETKVSWTQKAWENRGKTIRKASENGDLKWKSKLSRKVWENGDLKWKSLGKWWFIRLSCKLSDHPILWPWDKHRKSIGKV